MNYHLTLKSTNQKTGPILVSTTSMSSRWNGCALYGKPCYGGADSIAGGV